MQRNRKIYFFIIPLVMASGLLSRKFSHLLSNIINTYLGDALWAAMIYSIMAFLYAHKSPKQIAIFSLLFCYAIEISQLYHAPWIDAIRNTILGALVLGSGFLWSDLLAYALGIMCGFMVEYFLKVEGK